MSKLILIRHGESLWNLENKFTGWVDIPLTEKGKQDALRAGEKIANISLDVAFTSVLIRAIDTLAMVLQGAKQQSIQTYQSKTLNERHYGALQGLNKKETSMKFGEEQVKIWRRSYDIPPPKDKTELNPNGISESLKDTAQRTLPYFKEVILPEVQQGKNVIISAHGNSLRAIVMLLDNLSEKQVLELNIPNAIPIIYDYEGNKIIKKEILQ